MVEVGENRFAVVITGKGPGNARIRADAALATDGARPATQKPDAVLVIGLCGGLTEAMPKGQIVASAVDPGPTTGGGVLSTARISACSCLGDLRVGYRLRATGPDQLSKAVFLRRQSIHMSIHGAVLASGFPAAAWLYSRKSYKRSNRSEPSEMRLLGKTEKQILPRAH
jgi:hypothetical protein